MEEEGGLQELHHFLNRHLKAYVKLEEMISGLESSLHYFARVNVGVIHGGMPKASFFIHSIMCGMSAALYSSSKHHAFKNMTPAIGTALQTWYLQKSLGSQ
jgi:hypothetical protein